jgi:predicted DNA-binding protein with PD1-like motif
MQSRQVAAEGGRRIWVAVLDSGEEAKKAILDLARRENIRAASFVALGALGKAHGR